VTEQARSKLETRDKETFEGAIRRANAWLASVIGSNVGEALIEEWGKDFDGLHASPPVAVKITGAPARTSEIAEIEAWLKGPLSPSYRRFLSTVGQVTFMHRPHHPTYSVAEILPIAELYREMIDEYFEGYDQEGFAEEWGQAAKGTYQSWREWPKGSGVFRPEEVRDRNFLPICPGYEKDAHLLALHLADASGEAPVFQNYPDDGAAFFLRGKTFDAWMASMVDELILSGRPRSGRVLR
jgi:hypothetical protein